jgi:hypothetical protein
MRPFFVSGTGPSSGRALDVEWQAHLQGVAGYGDGRVTVHVAKDRIKASWERDEVGAFPELASPGWHWTGIDSAPMVDARRRAHAFNRFIFR